MQRLLLLLGIILSTSSSVLAGGHHGCCADCGGQRGLRRVCRWECEEVEEKVPGFACECEEVVIPGKSPHCIQEVCPDPCEISSTRHHGPHHKIVWGPPSDCCVKTVRVLVRKDKTVKKKVWKPVVETVCDRCCSNCAAGSLPADDLVDDVPPAVSPLQPVDAAGSGPGESEALFPPMPPPEVGRETSWRRGVNSVLSAFAPTTRRQ